jgi:hypothetical protein
MLLCIFLSCLYFIPGAMLLHGSLWIVTRGKHDFYDVLKVTASICLWFVFETSCTPLFRLSSKAYDFVWALERPFCLNIVVLSFFIMTPIVFMKTVFCAYIIKIDREERLGLRRALCVAAMEFFVFVLIFAGFFSLLEAVLPAEWFLLFDGV